MIPKVYYAHSLELYDTEQERQDVQRLQEHFPDCEIYNPNRKEIQQAKKPMVECMHVLKTDAIIALAFSHQGRRIPLGVYTEIKLAQKLYKPVYIIERDGDIHRYLGSMKPLKKDRRKAWAQV